MDIRKTTRDEIPGLARFLDDCWRFAYRDILPCDYLDSLDSDARAKKFLAGFDGGKTGFLIAVDDDQKDNNIIGAGVYGSSTNPNYSDCGEIMAIYVCHDSIGTGLGHNMFIQMEDSLKSTGYKKIILYVFTENHRAISFYQKHGYITIGQDEIELCGGKYPYLIMRKSI